MKHLLSILLICSIGFTQELTVDGNLNVTGNIQNQTIDSLLQVIQDLQSQLSALQGGNRLETKVYELSNLQTNDLIDLADLTGIENSWYQVKILDFTSSDDWNTADLRCLDENSMTVDSYAPTMYVWGGQKLSNGVETVCYTQFMKVGGHNGDFTISITTPFPPDPNVQQRKTGLQSKDKETNK